MVDPGRFWCPRCWVTLAHQAGGAYCPACAANLGPHQSLSQGRCSLCKKNKTMPLVGVCRLGRYAGALSGAVKVFKYHGSRVVGHRLADMLGAILAEQPWFPKIEALCPIPIHWTRRINRGFNQAQVLADEMALHVGRPAIRLLKRARITCKQVGLSQSQREENIKGAFAVRTRWPITGAAVCLVDDVMTTGATLFEAARTLKRAGAGHVYAAVLARAEVATDA
jgi:ComF family protein